MAKPAFDPTKPFEPVQGQAAEKPAFDPSKPFEVATAEAGPSKAEIVETAFRGLFESALLGGSEPAISKVNAVLGNLIESGFDAESLKDFFSKSIDTARIEKEYQADIARRKELKEELPVAQLVGTIAGAFAPVGPAAALAKGVGAVAKGVAGATKLSKLGRVGEAAITGAAQAATPTLIEQNVLESTGFITPEEKIGVGEAALFGAKLGGAARAVPEIIGGVKAAAPVALSIFGGPRVEAIQKYLLDPEAIKRAKSDKEIKKLVDKYASGLKEQVETGDISLKNAKELLRESKDTLSRTVSEKKADIRDAFRDATENFKVAKAEMLEPLKRARVPATLTQDILDSAEDLKVKLSEESKKSYEILESLEARAKKGEIQRLNLGDVPEFIKNLQDDLKVGGKVRSEAEKEAFNVLQKQLASFADFSKPGKEIVSYPTVKRLIQSLDLDIAKYGDANSAQFSELSKTKLLELRRGLDSLIKESPEYATQMEKVAALRELQNEIAPVLGNRQNQYANVAGKLENIWKPKSLELQDSLRRLGEATNRPIASQMDELIKIKTMASQPLVLEQMARSLPEAEALKKLQLQQQKLTRPGVERMLAPKEVKAVERSMVQVERAQQFADEAKAALKDIGPFANELSNFNAIRTAVVDRNPEYDNILQMMSKASNQDFVQMVNDLRLAEQFSKDFTQGSRNVNFFSIISGGLAAMATGSMTAGAVIAAIGSGIGKTMDRFGGRVTQKILDGYLKVTGIPTVKKINAVLGDMPPSVRNYTIGEFVRQVTPIRNEVIFLQQEQIPQVISEIKDSDIDSVSKAKAIKELERFGTVQSDTIKKVMLGAQPKTQKVTPDFSDSIKEDRPDVLKKMMEKK